MKNKRALHPTQAVLLCEIRRFAFLAPLDPFQELWVLLRELDTPDRFPAIFTRDTTIATFYLLACTPSPF